MTDAGKSPYYWSNAALDYSSDQAGSKPVDGPFLARRYDDPVSLHAVSVVGELQVQHDGTWSTIGRLSATSSCAHCDVDPTWPVTGVRIRFTAGPDTPAISALVAR